MIELTRVQLINWHNFQDVCIPFRMVSYLIGVNAVGKTTIMDAIRYCLTTNKDFNAAGNRLSRRTLQGSVHGKQRGENSYLRPNHTVAYVGVEFLDHEKNTHFVIAVRVESESPSAPLRHVDQDWFITKPGTVLENLRFLDQNRRPTKKDIFKASVPGIRTPATQKDARKYICLNLGIGDAESTLGKKFNEVFHMGTSLADISDITTFIKAYVLPEPEIKLDVLQSDMRELERLEETLQEAQERADCLSTIVEHGKQAQDLQTQVLTNEGLILLAALKKLLAQDEEYSDKVTAANLELDHLNPILADLNEKKARCQQALRNAERERDEDPQIQASSFYREQAKELSKEYRKQVARQQTWQRSLDDLGKLLKLMQAAALTSKVTLTPSGFLEQPGAEQKAALDALPPELEAVNSETDDRRFNLQTDLAGIQEKITSCAKELRILRDGRMSYPEEAELLQQRINEELSRRGMEPDAKILCELLYMTDESWWNCAEAALGRRRFDIIVSPKHYYAAKGVFSSLGEQVKDISLVNTRGLEHDERQWSSSDPGTLPDKIGSENLYAKLYVNYLLHGIICCEDADQLEQYSRSVTKDLLRHQGYRLQRMKKPRLYIGADARKQRIAALEKDLRDLEERRTIREKVLKSLSNFNSVYQAFVHGNNLYYLQNYLDAPAKVTELYDQLSEVQRKIKEFESNPLLANLFDRCARCEDAVKQVENDIKDVQHKIWEQEKLGMQAQETHTQVVIEADAAQTEWENFSLAHPELTDEINAHYEEAARTRTAEQIEQNQTNYRTQCIRNLERYVSDELHPLQRDYNTKYAADHPLGLDGLGAYQDAYGTLEHIELERSLANLRQAQLRCKERFRKDILFRMKDDIRNAKSQFRELNQVMAELTYGEERYSFVIGEPKDRDLQAFHQIIMDKNNVQISEEDSLFVREATSQPAYEAQVDELMSRIMADVEQAAQDRSAGKRAPSEQVSKYVDYRTYLEYDIEIENIKTGMKVPLSKVMGDSSGGENQAPFYVAICASLLQIYRHSPNSIRLVLLDEAFNNMTSDRIGPMMKMFKNAGLQLVLISTVEKCSAIYPYCDIVYSIVKDGARATFAPFEKLYEEED